MPCAELRMIPCQMAVFLDVAMRMPAPLGYLNSAVNLFGRLGRHEDARSAAWIGCLLAEDEIEVLMRLRGAWRRGEVRDPVDVGS